MQNIGGGQIHYGPQPNYWRGHGPPAPPPYRAPMVQTSILVSPMYEVDWLKNSGLKSWKMWLISASDPGYSKMPAFLYNWGPITQYIIHIKTATSVFHQIHNFAMKTAFV